MERTQIQNYHLDDRTMKFKSMTQSKRQHQYLGLPGEFKLRYPQEVIYPNMDSGRMDELYLTTLDILVNLEEESEDIKTETLKKFAKHAIFARFKYCKKVYLAVLCHKDPGKEFECFTDSDSVIIKVHYIYFKQEDLWDKYDTVINKIKHNVELNEMESLDMAFICKFIDGKYKDFIIDSITGEFENAKIPDKKLKMDVAIIIEAMIIKHIKSEIKQNEYIRRINMRQYRDEMERILYEEFGDELESKDNKIESMGNELKSKENEIESQKQEIKDKDKKLGEYKSKINQLNDIEDKSSPEALKVINALFLMK